LLFQLPKQHIFPDPKLAEPDGLLAVGGDLNANRVLKAYQKGVFPWFSGDEPIMWWSPNPRFVISPASFKVSKSMRPIIRKYNYKVTINTAFQKVIANCKIINRRGQNFDSWITNDMQQAYNELHHLGHTLAVEMWNKDGELTGGLYGLLLGTVFCGESMFANTANASKIAFIHFANFLFKNGCTLIDCQTHTDHLESFGAQNLNRTSFLKLLKIQQHKAMHFKDLNKSFATHFKNLKAEKSVFF